MNPIRAVAVVSALMGLGALASLSEALREYQQSTGALEWKIAYGRIIDRADVTFPSFYCFVRDTRYSLIKYRYEGTDGTINFGEAQAPIGSEFGKGNTIEVRYNPKEQNQSVPSVSIPAYKAASRGVLLLSLPFGLAFLYVARRLWREGAENRSNPSFHRTLRDKAAQRR